MSQLFLMKFQNIDEHIIFFEEIYYLGHLHYYLLKLMNIYASEGMYGHVGYYRGFFVNSMGFKRK